MGVYKYEVIRTDFIHLKDALNNLDENYPGYTLYQILSENSHDGSFAVIILRGIK